MQPRKRARLTARMGFKAPKQWAPGEKRGQQRSLACMWMGSKRMNRLCICMFADEIEGFRSLSPVWITNPHQGRGKATDREEQEETDFRLLSKRGGGVWYRALKADVPNWQRKEKKRPKGLVDPELNFYLSKSAKYPCGASGRIAPPGCQSKFWEVVFRGPFVVACGAC